jgi:cellulose synthase (UDP-forming)
MVANMGADYRIVVQDELLPMVSFWLLLNMLVMILVAMMCLEKPRIRGEERFAIREPLTLLSDNGHMITSGKGDISLSGLGLEVEEAADLSIGDRVQVVLPEVGIVRGFVRRTGRRIGIAFDFHSEDVRDRLIVWLFTNRIEVNAQRPSALAVAGAVIRRLWQADLTVHAIPAIAPQPEAPEIKLSAATRLIEPAAVRKLATAHLDADAVLATYDGGKEMPESDPAPASPGHRKAA